MQSDLLDDTFALRRPHVTGESPNGNQSPTAPSIPTWQRADEAENEVWRPGSRVLVVENADLVRNATTKMLERSNYTVLATKRGEEAVERFHEFSTELCCVLLDVSLPGMSSADILECFREIDGHVPVVAVSGFMAAGVKERLRGQRIEGVVQKPYQASQLIHAVELARQGTASGFLWG